MDKTTKKNAAAYDATVEQFDQRTKELEEPEQAIRGDFMALLRKNGSILDIGCGPGRDAHIFTDGGFRVVGIDVAPKMIEKAKTIAPKAEFHVMDMFRLGFKEGSFDGIWFNAGLLCIPKIQALPLLKRIKQILNDKGIVWISVKEGQSEGFEIDKRYNTEKYFAYYSQDELAEVVKKAGFGTN